MTENVVSCDLADHVDRCLRLMARNQVRRLPVVDDAGVLAGIISQADLARHAEDHAGKGERRSVASMVGAISEPIRIGGREREHGGTEVATRARRGVSRGFTRSDRGGSATGARADRGSLRQSRAASGTDSERFLAPISSAPTGATQRHLEIRARSFAHSRGAGQVVICDRSSWIRTAGRWPAHRAHRRATLLPATAPRSDAEPARHFPARRRERGRQAARSADEPIPRRRSPRPCPAAVSHEDSPASRTDGPSMQARRPAVQRCTPFPDDADAGRSPALRVAPQSRTTPVQGKGLRSSVAPQSRIDVDAGQSPAVQHCTPFPADAGAGQSPALRVALQSRMTSMQTRRSAVQHCTPFPADAGAGQSPALRVALQSRMTSMQTRRSAVQHCTPFPDDAGAGQSPALRVALHSRPTSMQAKPCAPGAHVPRDSHQIAMLPRRFPPLSRSRYQSGSSLGRTGSPPSGRPVSCSSSPCELRTRARRRYASRIAACGSSKLSLRLLRGATSARG